MAIVKKMDVTVLLILEMLMAKGKTTVQNVIKFMNLRINRTRQFDTFTCLDNNNQKCIYCQDHRLIYL